MTLEEFLDGVKKHFPAAVVDNMQIVTEMASRHRIGRSDQVLWVKLRFGERCHTGTRGSDGECSWARCPQLRDNEPKATGRSCPLIGNEEEDG